jgi:hypothetical protein
MKSKRFFLASFLSANLIVVSSFAQTATGGAGAATGSTSMSGITLQNSSPTSLPQPVLPTSPSGNIQGQAQNGQSANNAQNAMAQAAEMISAMIAAANAGPCFKTPPDAGACTLMAAGIAGVAISAMIGSAAQQAADGAGDTAAQVTSDPSTGIASPADNTAPAGASNPDLVAALAGMKAAGLNYNPSTNTVSLPNGSSVSGSDLAAGNMGGMGLSSSQQDAAKTALAGIMKDAESKIKSAGNLDEYASSGGGGGGGGSSSSSDTPAAVAAAKKDERKPASVSGMKKVLDNGNDAIGVSTDSIWTMIANRYKVKGDQGSFVTTTN